MTLQLPTHIGTIPVDAPLFRGASPRTLQNIIDYWSSASYHFADDSAKEWGTAKRDCKAATALIIAHELSFDAIAALHASKSQLVSLADVMDSIMAQGRKA